MKQIGLLFIIAAVAAAVAACSSEKQTAGGTAPVYYEGTYLGGAPSMLPKAVIYQTNGDYTANVAVTLSPDGKQLVSYPAPSDVSANSEPVALGNGWLLDRRGGIGMHTAFLKYTYAEYAKLPAPPTHEQLLASVIPDAKVTLVRTLPITASAAIADPALAEKYAK